MSEMLAQVKGTAPLHRYGGEVRPGKGGAKGSVGTLGSFTGLSRMGPLFPHPTSRRYSCSDHNPNSHEI